MFPLTPHAERNYLWTIVTWLFVALCLFAVIQLLAPMCNAAHHSGQPHAVADTASSTVEAPAALTDERAAATARLADEEARARSRARLCALQHQAKQIAALTRAFERQHDDWNTLASAVLTDDRGRRLASDPDAVLAYRSLTQIARSPRNLADQVRERLAILLQPVQSALAAAESAYMPSDDFGQLIDSERKLILAASESYAQAHRRLEGMLAASAERTGTATLAEVIRQQMAAEARAETAAVAAATGAAAVQVRESLAEAEGTKVREIGQSEAARIKAQQDAEQARIDAHATRIRQQGERERLLSLAKDPDIQARFAPFLIAGRRYPARYEGSVRWLERKPWGRTAPRPVSLRELKTGGVLDNLDCFVAAATSSKSKTGAQNDRPHWPTPSPAEWDARSADFALFQELLPVWVELHVIAAD